MKIPSLSDRCGNEATRDAMFVFQRRLLRFNCLPRRGYTIDEDFRVCKCDEDGKILYDEDGEAVEVLTLDEAFRNRLEGEHGGDCVSETWHSEGVWLSREEAEEYGRNRSYNYEDGWRVYAVPGNGVLIELLKRHDAERIESERFEYTPETPLLSHRPVSWVSCDDRLPNLGNYVLTKCHDGITRRLRYDWWSRKWYRAPYQCVIYQPLAWMEDR